MSLSILFVTDTVPSNSMASAVLFYRHLKILSEKGCKISILTHQLAPDIDLVPESWDVKVLPARRWWYPPYRPFNILKPLRHHILYSESKKFICRAKPDLIIGYLQGVNYSAFAAFVAKKINAPLVYFYHDRMEEMVFYHNIPMQNKVSRYNARLIDQASSIWTISPKLIYNNPKWQNKFKVVYPIPQDIPEKAIWRDSNNKVPVIAYAGALYNEVVSTMISVGKELKKINGSLLLMTQLSDNVMKIKQVLDNIIVADPRDTLAACNYIRSNATAFIVAYPSKVADMPWMVSLFPSKFTQFIQTGIPTFVFAPTETAIGQWCIQNNWIGYESHYDQKSIDDLLALCTQKSKWEQMAKQSIYFAENEFAQQKIQAIIETDIQKLTGKNLK